MSKSGVIKVSASATMYFFSFTIFHLKQENEFPHFWWELVFQSSKENRWTQEMGTVVNLPTKRIKGKGKC